MAELKSLTKQVEILDATIKALDPDDPAGTFEAVLSVPTPDRDSEVIDAGAFNPLPDHITIDVDHGMSTAATIGSGTPFYEGDLLKFRGTFSTIPRAQEVRTLVVEGHIRKMSVAFMNAIREVDEKDGHVHIRTAELLNAAIVPIPSNREASIFSAKDGKVGARNSEKDAERLQQIHDLTVANGAACKHAAADDTKLTVTPVFTVTTDVANIADSIKEALEAASASVKNSTVATGQAAAPAPAITSARTTVAKALALAAEAELLLL